MQINKKEFADSNAIIPEAVYKDFLDISNPSKQNKRSDKK